MHGVRRTSEVEKIYSGDAGSAGTGMEVDVDDVSIKATTTEKLGFTGREEGISAYATVLIEKD